MNQRNKALGLVHACMLATMSSIHGTAYTDLLFMQQSQMICQGNDGRDLESGLREPVTIFRLIRVNVLDSRKLFAG